MHGERQTPQGLFNLALSYLDAADELTRRLVDRHNPLKLSFESPVRHLYAHTWELALKACLFRQGLTPVQLKRIGHNLTKAWDLVDHRRFAALRLTPRVRIMPEVLDQFHPTRIYAYPVSGYRQEFTLVYIRDASQRFRLTRTEIIDLFGSP